jgi:peptide/nickel transport system substrate-binding protein
VFDNTRVGPAPPVPGARRGGTLVVLRTAAVVTDPASAPAADRPALRLVLRTLTGILRTPGGLDLVGDLATDTGQVSADGLTWTYHLRGGIRFADGSPITAADVARGLGPALLPPGLAVRAPDPRTVVLALAKPDPQLPLVLASTALSPVPSPSPVPLPAAGPGSVPAPLVLAARATGPYRPRTTAPLVLERNPNWDPATDPIRNAYPDEIRFEVDTAGAILSRLAEPTVVADIVSPAGPGTPVRRVLGPTGTGYYLLINTARVADLNLRRAINYAIDRGAAVDALTGSVPMTTILPALVRGPTTFDAYPAGAHGDLDTGRRLLAGRFRPDLTLCTDPSLGTAGLDTVVQRSLDRIGVPVTVRPFTLADYRPATTVCDLIPISYSPAYPDGDQVLGQLFGPGPDYSGLDQPSVAAQLAALAAQPDRAAAASRYLALDQTIMRDYAPVVPLAERVGQAVVGPRVVTAQVDPVSGAVDLDSVSLATQP